MIITTKYNVEDRVYTIEQEKQIEYIACPACAGEGEILGKDNVEYDCPRGNGCGEILHAVNFPFYIQLKIIRGITIEIRRDGETRTTYWLSNTDCISGWGHDEVDIFPTAEEAQKACDERNKE